MTLVASSKLPLRLTFVLGVLCPADVSENDTVCDTARLAGVEKVPLVPSGKVNVCMSTDESAVVGFAIDEREPDLSLAFNRDGLGGSGGRCSLFLPTALWTSSTVTPGGTGLMSSLRS